jgi:hypothetical protein
MVAWELNGNIEKAAALVETLMMTETSCLIRLHCRGNAETASRVMFLLQS